MTSENGPQARAQRPLQKTSAIEWGVAFLGFLVVAAATLYMLFYASKGAEGPPLLRVSQVSVAPMGDAYALRFRARNEGGATVASVHLSAELTQGEEVVERAEASLDYLPRNSNREGAFVFSRDPQDYEVRLRVEGYSEP